jgi:SAM-dependent methyltransferase
MQQDRRDQFIAALEDARQRGYPAGEYVGQESFMTAEQIRQLALRAGIRAGTSVLDLCCGVAGPGRLITAESDCSYLGVDYSASALRIARDRAGDLPCRFLRQRIPPLPRGRFDVVLLLETLLAFPDKATLFEGVSSALGPGGRFVCTVETGNPLSAGEQLAMPDPDTVWLLEWAELIGLLARAGLNVVWSQDCTAAHQATASALLSAYRSDAVHIAELIGQKATEELITAHQLWSDWLAAGRVRKFALVAQRA